MAGGHRIEGNMRLGQASTLSYLTFLVQRRSKLEKMLIRAGIWF